MSCRIFYFVGWMPAESVYLPVKQKAITNAVMQDGAAAAEHCRYRFDAAKRGSFLKNLFAEAQLGL